jgi:large subunit ribosomal protein L6
VEGNQVTAEGPKGKVAEKIPPGVSIELANGVLLVQRQSDEGPIRARHGLIRALLANAVEGVSKGFSRGLEVVGVGYRAELKGREVHFALGYSHPVVYRIPEGVSIEVDSKAGKLTVSSANKQLLGQVCAEIRNLRKPDPYKGKGIKYAEEVIKRKAGKSATK